jgi:D-beta-D-heptose 7-phosphate kinase/D-beta-D-heptose 1-phosphate adenosyltransferase
VSKKRILVVGDLMIDRYVTLDDIRISQESPVPCGRVANEVFRLGGAGNVAENLAAQGCIVGVLFCGYRKVFNSEPVIGEAALRGINFYNVCESNRGYFAPQIPVKTRYVHGGKQMFRADYESTAPPGHFVSPWVGNSLILEKFERLLPELHAVVLSDYLKGVLTCTVCEEIIKACKAKEIPVLVDPKGFGWNKYIGADIVKANLTESRNGMIWVNDVGFDKFNNVMEWGENDDDITRFAYRAAHCLKAKHVIITRGKQGATWHDFMDHTYHHVRGHSFPVFDVTGAGDTFIATLARCVAEKLEMKEAVTLANLAAGIAVSKEGTSVVSRREIEEALLGPKESSSKIFTFPEAKMAADVAKGQGKKIVFTNGIFDIIHPGHIHLLREAKKCGDFLFVGVNSDESTCRIKPGRPMTSSQERMDILSALEMVDAVVRFEDDTPLELIKLLMPDVLVKGGDYQASNVVGADLVCNRGGSVKIVPRIAEYSTSNLLANLTRS